VIFLGKWCHSWCRACSSCCRLTTGGSNHCPNKMFNFSCRHVKMEAKCQVYLIYFQVYSFLQINVEYSLLLSVRWYFLILISISLQTICLMWIVRFVNKNCFKFSACGLPPIYNGDPILFNGSELTMACHKGYHPEKVTVKCLDDNSWSQEQICTPTFGILLIIECISIHFIRWFNVCYHM
jgi:hypothetical protein